MPVCVCVCMCVCVSLVCVCVCVCVYVSVCVVFMCICLRCVCKACLPDLLTDTQVSGLLLFPPFKGLHCFAENMFSSVIKN